LLGNIGESLSIVGFGAIAFVNEGPDFARETVARAIDAGVNFDMGPAYGRGEAEERGGPAIEPDRDRIFLAEKTGKRTKDEAAYGEVMLRTAGPERPWHLEQRLQVWEEGING